MQTQALHLAAKSGLKDKFSGSLTFEPITKYELRQCFQSDSGRSSGSFNLNPGVLLWNLVRMNQVAMQRSPRLTPGQFGIALPRRCLQGILNFRNWRMPLASFSVGRIVPEGYRSYGRFVIDADLSKQDEILAMLSEADRRRIGVDLGVITKLDHPMPPNMYYELSAFAACPVDLPPQATFMSERGHMIWILKK
jgi:hypothetical protein